MRPTPTRSQSGAVGLPPLSERTFRRFRDLIYQEAGIALTEGKTELLRGRLARRLRALELPTLEHYLDLVTRDGSGREMVHLLDCICTNETQFFRDARQFECLERDVFPAFEARPARGGSRRLRVWSAACSTGEEPYSLAMAMLTRFPRDAGWQVDILATDLSTSALAQARAGVWPIDRARDVPQRHLRTFMLRGVGERRGEMKATSALRTAIRFERLNLNDAAYGVLGPFDVIFCRNVLIYFDRESRRRALDRVVDLLAPEGYLFLGTAETIAGQDRLRPVGPNMYATTAGLTSTVHSPTRRTALSEAQVSEQ